MVIQKNKESRKDYLYRVAIALLENNREAQELTVDYDDTTCDGHCLLGEMKDELDKGKDTLWTHR